LSGCIFPLDPVDRSRSISTVDKESPTGEYGRNRRSMPIHLRRITFDCRWSIKNRDNFVVDFINDTCANLPRFPNVSSSVTRGGRQTEKSKKNAARAGWPRRFALIQATSRAEVDVISAKLCSCDRAIFSWRTLSWSDRSFNLTIVDNSPNMHNTCFFVWIPYLARYSEIFRKPNFQVVIWKSAFIWKMLSRRNWKPKDPVCLQSLVCLPPLAVNVKTSRHDGQRDHIVPSPPPKKVVTAD